MGDISVRAIVLFFLDVRLLIGWLPRFYRGLGLESLAFEPLRARSFDVRFSKLKSLEILMLVMMFSRPSLLKLAFLPRLPRVFFMLCSKLVIS